MAVKTYNVLVGIDIPVTKAAAKPGAWMKPGAKYRRFEPGDVATADELKHAPVPWLLNKGCIEEEGSS